MTDLPCFSKDRWKQQQKASVRTRTAIVDSSALPFGNGTSLSPSCSNLLAFPAIHSRFFGFGPRAMRSAVGLARSWFKGGRAQALFAGNSAHAIFPLQHPSSAGFGLMLSMSAHAVGWPIARGGSQAIADALASYLLSLGGTIKVGAPVSSMTDLPTARAVLFDVTPRQLARIAGSIIPSDYLERLQRHRYGSGVFKVDWALDGPIPWRDPRCSQAGTLHLGGTLEEIAAAELDVWRGVLPEKPFVLLSQPSLFDSSRAPERASHGLGILPCSQWVRGRHDPAN